MLWHAWKFVDLPQHSFELVANPLSWQISQKRVFRGGHWWPYFYVDGSGVCVCVHVGGGGGGIYVQPLSVLHKQDFPHLQPSPVNVKCVVSTCPGSVFRNDVAGNQLLQILCWIFFWSCPGGSITACCLLLNPSHPLACINYFVCCIFMDAVNPQRGITGNVHLAVYWPIAVLSLPLDFIET